MGKDAKVKVKKVKKSYFMLQKKIYTAKKILIFPSYRSSEIRGNLQGREKKFLTFDLKRKLKSVSS